MLQLPTGVWGLGTGAGKMKMSCHVETCIYTATITRLLIELPTTSPNIIEDLDLPRYVFSRAAAAPMSVAGFGPLGGAGGAGLAGCGCREVAGSTLGDLQDWWFTSASGDATGLGIRFECSVVPG